MKTLVGNRLCGKVAMLQDSEVEGMRFARSCSAIHHGYNRI